MQTVLLTVLPDRQQPDLSSYLPNTIKWGLKEVFSVYSMQEECERGIHRLRKICCVKQTGPNEVRVVTFIFPLEGVPPKLLYSLVLFFASITRLNSCCVISAVV